MRSSLRAEARPFVTPVADHPSPIRPEERLPLVSLSAGAAAVCLMLAAAAVLPHPPSPAALGEVILFAAGLIATVALLSLARGPAAWEGTTWAAGAATVATAVQLGGRLSRVWTAWPAEGRIALFAMIFLLFIFLGVLVVEFRQHVTGSRMDILSDAVVVALVASAALFLLLEGQRGTRWDAALWTAVGLEAVVAFAGWSVLTLWCPSCVHFALFACATLASGASLTIVHAVATGAPPDGLMAPEVGAALSILAVAGVLVIEPRLNTGHPVQPRVLWWIRPALLGLALCAGFAIMGIGFLGMRPMLSAAESLFLSSLVFAAIGVRSLFNHVTMARASGRLGDVLRHREEALGSLRDVAEYLSSSEARHRRILEAAADGIVELDGRGVITQANDAFCAMVHLTAGDVLGRTWGEMAAAAGDPEGTLAVLPETGHATVTTETGPGHLEARSSTIPTSPPGTLLLIRDVTSAKVADQTIRSLFQFLQDRDEDRTRLLKRTSAAIEVERNRIARDLHDGPVQGISAAALSVEAVRMMVEKGDIPRAAATLQTVAGELSQEASGLRRIMSDLRPPVLQQRGLIPAVRELAARLQNELDLPVEASAVSNSEVPSEIETLAYRVIQEALSNVGKHSSASHVRLRIEAGPGTLHLDIEDDGVGFDIERGREFLEAGKVGLASMRERAELIGGTFIIRSSPESGTTIAATLPFEVLASRASEFGGPGRG